ncbi:NAD-dependent protein deacylase [Aeromonas caviae]|uniref:NAD-dependent deacylase n=1 Tax=Aeromonas caviae TaxID=648 RepID=UPI0011189D82|nr:NAD-dependent deacylase [Aeromonas caviae]TNH76554.1 NAD-dependent protein deacylase [Aeromonas caviae]
MVQSAKHIVILTGAGISAESGIKTFRACDGLWEEHRVEDVATPEGYARDPELVQRFYNARRHQLQRAEIHPNPAHYALARPGSKNLIHMHGELLKARCPGSGQVIEWRGDLHQEELCSCCQFPHPLRPHVVWFGEMPLGLDRIYSALAQCDLFISIGTSGAVYPAAGFVHEAGLNGAHTVELNLEPSEVGSQFDEKRYGPASLLVPAFVDELLQSCGVHQPLTVEGHNWMEMRGP